MGCGSSKEQLEATNSAVKVNTKSNGKSDAKEADTMPASERQSPTAAGSKKKTSNKFVYDKATKKWVTTEGNKE